VLGEASCYSWDDRRQLTIRVAAVFHGHEGPWLVLGYRAGWRAVEVLEPRSVFEMSCVVRAPLSTPFTCAADGIQVAAGCTLGKLNIKLEPVRSPEEIEYVFTCRGRTLHLKLKPWVWSRIKEISSESGLTEASRWCMRQELHTMFEELLEP